MTLLLIDNYDSFTYNLMQYFAELGQDDIIVKRNDMISIDEIVSLNPNYIVLSPGPGNPLNPKDFGICKDIIEQISHSIPTLGICLGHQGIGAIFGGLITKATQIKHGKTSTITHNNTSIFNGLPNPIIGGRYHSLVIDQTSIPKELDILATSEDNEIMAIKHSLYPIIGLQFHPESILTTHGKQLLTNFLKLNNNN